MSLFTGCSKAEKVKSEEPASKAESKVETVKDEVEADETLETNVPEGGYVVGVSNGFIGNGWRTQMINSIELLGENYKGRGLIKELIIQNAGLDVNNQIAQIRNLINAEVDLLIIDPNSETALNPVIEEAHNAGILVISFDQPVTSDLVTNVVIDQVKWGTNIAEWFVDEIGGKGDIVMVTGLAGHPANVNRLRGINKVLEGYPDINILTEANGDWDQASSQQAMSNLLASYPKIDGVLSQDGMALGIANAYEAAGKELPVITGDAMMGFIQRWKVLKEDGFNTYAQNNPPGIGATALGIGIRMLQGKKVKDLEGNNYFYPVKDHITSENFDEYYAKYETQPDSYFIDEWLSEEELDALME